MGPERAWPLQARPVEGRGRQRSRIL